MPRMDNKNPSFDNSQLPSAINPIETIMFSFANLFFEMGNLLRTRIPQEYHFTSQSQRINQTNFGQSAFALSKKQSKKQTGFSLIQTHKPRHPVSSYFIFFKEKRKEIAKQHGQVLGSRIAKVVGNVWKNMTPEQKEPYDLKSKQSREAYEKQMIDYKKNYGQEIKKIKHERMISRLKLKYETQRMQIAKFFEPRLFNPTITSAAKEPQQVLNIPELSPLPSVKIQQFPSRVISDEEKYSSASSLSSDELGKDNLSDSLELQHQEDTLHEQKVENPQYNALAELLNKGREPEIPSIPEKIEPICKIEQVPCKIQQIAEQPSTNNHQQSLFPCLQQFQEQVNQEQNQEQIQTVEMTQSSANLQRSTFMEQIKQDIVKPKGPVSSFLIYYRRQKKNLSKQHNLPQGHKLLRVASEIWKKMSPKKKKIYEDEAKESRKFYLNEVERIKEEHGIDMIAEKKAKKNRKRKYKRKRQ